MKKLDQVVIILGIICLIFAVPSWGQPEMPGPGKGFKGPKGPGAKMFDPKAVETLSGEVVAVESWAPRRAEAPQMVHLTLKTDKETVRVMLGPSTYLDQQPVKITKGDQVEVKGFRQTRPRGTVITAQEVKKGDQVLKLRDAQGIPLYPPQGPRRQAISD
jgi:hypothetical protein